MNKSGKKRNPDFKPGSNIGGYLIKKLVELKGQDSIFYELEHIATGAKHIHISCEDTENTFSVAFKTVPFDSTGVAHILEHTVLCGSGKFPVRDPFFSMLKRSLSTFMNAFTASDWTMYPFATQNRKDFYNLMDVYLDAVFFPNIDELSFKQEGHRIEIEDSPAAKGKKTKGNKTALVYKGVVYNEMKGAMSSPDQVMARSLLNALYPDNTYRFNSGGEPSDIPDLTHAGLVAFHKRHYHPSNAFFYTYGNMPLEDHLDFIEERVLSRFDRINPDTEVPSQQRWTASKEVTYSYPLGTNEDPDRKCQICLAWLISDVRDTFENLAVRIIGHILLGNSASPLRKALIDSGLGSTLCDGTGFDTDNRDTMFTVGLKDVANTDAPEIESMILKVVRDLAENGIDKKMVESALHQIEFHHKEITNTPYPYGIKLMLRISSAWFHGGEAEDVLQFDSRIERIRRESARGQFFEDRLKKYFLDNNHRVLFTLVPDQGKSAREAARVASELEKIMAGMTAGNLESIKQDAEDLKKLQETGEDLSSLPTLELEDIPVSVNLVKESGSYPRIPATCYNKATSGIFYFTAALGINGIDQRLRPLIPFFCHAFSRIGTLRHNYTEMAQLIDEYTGGIGAAAYARTSFDVAGNCISYIAVGGKSLERNQGKMFEIAEELLTGLIFSDHARLKNLLLEYRAALESMVVQNGHRLAISLASRNLAPACALGETWSGIHHLQAIKNITGDLIDKKLGSIADDLHEIGKSLFARNNYELALVGEDRTILNAAPFADVLQKEFGVEYRVEPDIISCDRFMLSDMDQDGINIREGWSTSTAVSFVAQAFRTVRMGHEDAPALSLISKLLKSLFLHREIREKGGAYGGFALYNSEDGVFSFGSYRDPHIAATLKVYENAFDFIKKGAYTEEDIKEAILQKCSGMDTPDPPAPAARKAFHRKLAGLTDSARMQFKEQLLSLTRAEVMKTAEKYFNKENNKQSVAVISGEEQLKEANTRLPGEPLSINII
ncbi:MAG: insulinase family protein [Deltaproteobacteria bacterium]|nr:insulinase family protein [Deltaproteobacteria bacterium]